MKYYFVSFTGVVKGVRKFGSAYCFTTEKFFPFQQFVRDHEEEYGTDIDTFVVLNYKEVSEDEYNYQLFCYDLS